MCVYPAASITGSTNARDHQAHFVRFSSHSDGYRPVVRAMLHRVDDQVGEELSDSYLVPRSSKVAGCVYMKRALGIDRVDFIGNPMRHYAKIHRYRRNLQAPVHSRNGEV